MPLVFWGNILRKFKIFLASRFICQLFFFSFQLSETEEHRWGGTHRLNGCCCFNLKVLLCSEELKLLCIKIDFGELNLRFSRRINSHHCIWGSPLCVCYTSLSKDLL